MTQECGELSVERHNVRQADSKGCFQRCGSLFWLGWITLEVGGYLRVEWHSSTRAWSIYIGRIIQRHVWIDWHFCWWMNVFFFCRFTRSKLKAESLSKLGSLLYYLDQTQDMSFDRSLQWCYNTARQTNKVGAKKAPICTSCGAVSGRERRRIAQMQEIPFPLVKWLANTSPWGKVISDSRCPYTFPWVVRPLFGNFFVSTFVMWVVFLCEWCFDSERIPKWFIHQC